ncbi:hypothetical protein [Allokutzneria albata]|uniref:Uncharacterized protein n=1 Tax=Allokutzneria albata TaxID=211114 RepID=A0A1G9WD47_ALLAB|nr:hypothetical protein [Allokutzneria albata]SDM82410.1 hypothetical protein SAMN04489726_3539 [Allokutzneria albata]
MKNFFIFRSLTHLVIRGSVSVSRSRIAMLGMTCALVFGSAVSWTAVTAVADEEPRAAWHQPGDRRGGVLVFDGFTDRNLSRVGLFSMIYHLPGLTDNKSCFGVVSNSKWPKEDWDYFAADAHTTKRVHLREEREFDPVGPVETVRPNVTKEVSSDRSVTQKWEYSAGLSLGGVGLVEAITATGGFSYSKEVTVSKGESASVTNVSQTDVQEYSYGIYRDVYVVQQRPWRVMWAPEKGSPFFAGDEFGAVARWFPVPQKGCYRTAQFSTVTVPRAKGFGLVGEYPVDRQPVDSCRNAVNTDNAQVFRKTTTAGLPVFTPIGKVARGTCFTLSGAEHKATGQLFTQVIKLDKVNGACPENPAALCEENLWVDDSHISDPQVTPPPLRSWGTGTELKISKQVDKEWKVLTNPEFSDVALIRDAKDTWTLKHYFDNVWRLAKSNTPNKGYCLHWEPLSLEIPKLRVHALDDCGSKFGWWRIEYDTNNLYFRLRDMNNLCAEATTTNGVHNVATRKCARNNLGQRWQLTRVK